MKIHAYYSKSAAVLANRIDQYFNHIEGSSPIEQKTVCGKNTTTKAQKVLNREPEAATIAGMALFLGFSSKQEFEAYEDSGKHARVLKRGRLRLEAAYESRLYQTPTGVIFALKTLGWNDKPEVQKPVSKTGNTLKVEILNTGPLPAGSEKEVML
ncbi:terminase small subunit [Mucilaginibacter sp. NFX135]|uniref:terminase small subunit n=1 Tax=Mucilaginibacter sp. NFX135 TaxID=3402687 RepID=UPI003AFA33DE